LPGIQGDGGAGAAQNGPSEWQDDAGTRAAAEFVVHGKYLATDEGLPEANGQTYLLPAGAYFDLAEGKIARVSVYYNLADWTRQVGG
jgi:steroid delta-isomerase-like uncharacterized protein